MGEARMWWERRSWTCNFSRVQVQRAHELGQKWVKRPFTKCSTHFRKSTLAALIYSGDLMARKNAQVLQGAFCLLFVYEWVIITDVLHCDLCSSRQIATWRLFAHLLNVTT